MQLYAHWICTLLRIDAVRSSIYLIRIRKLKLNYLKLNSYYMIEITLIFFYCLNVLINRQLNKYTFNKYNHIREPEKWLSSIFGTRYFLIKIIKRQKDNWFTGKYWYESKKKQGLFSNIINF